MSRAGHVPRVSTGTGAETSGHRTAGEESGKKEKFDKLIQTMGH